MFEAVVGLFSAIARAAPILLVLDDLHWADRPTLLLLRHLARATDPRRLLILAAYRAVETTSGGFALVLADLHREQLLFELRIAGLSEAETAELVHVRTGETPAPAFAQALYRETEGNPLFVEEIVRHLADAGVRPGSAEPDALQRVGLPEGVKQVIARRLARLAPAAVEWLRVAAVIGRDFDAGLLERVLGVPETEFLDVLDEVLETGLVVDRGGDPGRYSFSHALIRETLYEGMSSPRRARLHRRVGEALEAVGDEPKLGALALHFTRAAVATDAGKAIGYARAAGERATAMLAHEEAVEHYSRALEVLERFMPDDAPRRCELLLLLGEAQVRAGGPGLGWAALREAAGIADRLGDSSALARAAIAASRRYLQQPGVIEEELIALLERALARTSAQRTVARVLLLARLCGALYFSPQRHRMQALSREAGEIAEELDDDEARVYACAARRRALWEPTRLADRLAASTQMLRLAQHIGHLEQQLQAHAWLVVDLLEQGEREAVDAQIEAFNTGAARLRQPMFAWHAVVWRAMRTMLAGQLEAAESLAAEALAVGGPAEPVTAGQYFAIQLLTIRREQDRGGELVDATRAFVEQNPHRPAWRAALGNVLALSGREDEARECLEAVAAEGFAGVPADGDWLTALALAGELAAVLGDKARARELYERLVAHEDQIVVIGLGAACLGSCARYLGQLAACRGDEAAARGHFHRALRANAQLGAVSELAHTQVDYADLLGTGAEARKLRESAAATAQALGLARVARRAGR